MNACGHHHVGHIGILGVDKKGQSLSDSGRSFRTRAKPTAWPNNRAIRRCEDICDVEKVIQVYFNSVSRARPSLAASIESEYSL